MTTKSATTMLAYLKGQARRHRRLETVLFYFYTRFSFSYRCLQSHWLQAIIDLLKRQVIKNDVLALHIANDSTILELQDHRQFYWIPKDRNNLIGLGLLGSWEADENKIIRKIIKRGDVVVDIGANYGFYTILFSNLVGDMGQVHSFEPLKAIYQVLQKHVRLNNTQKNTVLNNIGVSNKKENGNIYIPKDMGYGAASLRQRSTPSLKKKCQLTTFDSYVTKNKITAVDFIKCDIEGGELPAFKGAAKSIKKFTPSLMFEVTRSASEMFNYTPEMLFDYLERFSYSFYFTYRGELVKLNKLKIPYFHGNCFAFHKNNLTTIKKYLGKK